jgi:flavin reductase (DIM6/NTAB) family NADH-FMN oxidoreductase RutF/DNA-binding MarR family transcriptional regulator
MTDVDVRELRNCFGKFATGITVITAIAPDGTKLGLTVNSFSSLSIDPPMILWSLDKQSKSMDALCAAPHFAVNVLASGQMDLSNIFARTSDEKFDGIELEQSELGLPLLAGTVAHFECRNINQIDGGDHVIFIGYVENFDMGSKKPLLYTNGEYTVAARHPGTRLAEPVEEARSSSDEFIIPLLLRSYWEISDPFYKELQDEGIPSSHARILIHLSHSPELTNSELSQAIRVDITSVAMSVIWLCDNGHLNRIEDNKLVISKKGLSHLNTVQSRAERFEKEILDGYSDQDVDMLKSMLRKLIYRSDV